MTMQDALVSIIIPARNRADLIGETLESIANQTHEQWELIVIDDGSTDDTANVVRAFSEGRRQRVRLLRHDQSQGAAAARNAGLAAAEGQYVALLDSDDGWFADHLETLVGAIEQSGVDLVYSIAEVYEDGTGRSLGPYCPGLEELQNFPESMFHRSYVVPSACMYRRSLVERVGPWSTEHLYCEDYDWFLRCIVSGCTFKHVCAVTIRYRKDHAGATTGKLCGTIEELAFTIASFAAAPNVSQRLVVRAAVGRLNAAARMHLASDPAKDPSANPLRGAELLMASWRLRPTRVITLLKAMACRVKVRGAANRKIYRERSKYIPTIAASVDTENYAPFQQRRDVSSCTLDTGGIGSDIQRRVA